MKLVFILNSNGWYQWENDTKIRLCQEGLAKCGLLLPNVFPAKIKLFLVAKNPKKRGFEKLVFVKYSDRTGSYFLDIAEYDWISFSVNTANWVKNNLACLFGVTPESFSMWAHVEELKE